MNVILQWKQPVSFRQAKVVGQVDPASGCNGRSALVLTGHGVTNASGKWRMELPTVVCPHLLPFDDDRPTFVAFPTDDDRPQPVVLSGAINGPSIQVQSWKLGGGEVGDVKFSWQCVIPSH